MHRKIIYLINPISGTRGKILLKETIAKETAGKGIPFEILHTRADGDYHFLIQKIRDESITDVVICGGDGSINAVSSALLGTVVNIGIIPMGSGNGLALAAGIPKNILRALELVFSGTASFIDGFYINSQFSCMLCGIGFDAKVAHAFAKEKKRGLMTYIKISVRHFFAAQPYAFDIEMGEQSFSTEAFLICIANSNQFGNNFTIAPEASLNDGLLDIVIVKKMHKLVLPFSVIRQVRGINVKQEILDVAGKQNIIYYQTPAITIINKDNAPLHIDGDPRETARRFNISIVRNAIRLIQPRHRRA
jgi:YegS/Rv2252/BmrU family lipid kinase